VVLTRTEIHAVLKRLQGVHRLTASLMYGAGLRVLECVRLRIKDVDLDRREIIVRDGKGAKDRVSVLPDALVERLRRHIGSVWQQHQEDLTNGLGTVALPQALERKYPHASTDWSWQWLFPASRHYRERLTGHRRRHHLHESAV